MLKSGAARLAAQLMVSSGTVVNSKKKRFEAIFKKKFIYGLADKGINDSTISFQCSLSEFCQDAQHGKFAKKEIGNFATKKSYRRVRFISKKIKEGKPLDKFNLLKKILICTVRIKHTIYMILSMCIII